MKTIVIEINEDGDCSVEGKGFHGPECDKLIKEVTQAIGRTESSRQKREYSEQTTRQTGRVGR